MPKETAICGLAEITRTRRFKSVGLKLFALTSTRMENERVIYLFTFTSCTEIRYSSMHHHNLMYYKFHETIMKTSEIYT